MIDHMKEALIALGHRVKGPNHKGWMNSKCPAHDDKVASFGYIPLPDGGYATHCFAGCVYADIVRALDLSPKQLGWKSSALEDDGEEWIPPPTFGPKNKKRKAAPDVDPSTTIVLPLPKGIGKPPPSIMQWQGRDPDFVWWYRDDAGRYLLACVRWDTEHQCRDCGDEPVEDCDRCKGTGIEIRKRVRHITYHEHRSGHVWKTGGIPSANRPLFAPPGTWAGDAPIIVVEGEKAAQAVPGAFSGHLGISPLGGAQATQVQDWQPIKDALASGREVYLWPDADDAGRKAMRWLAGHLGDGVRLVDVPDSLPKGWDLADPVPPGFDPAEALAAAADVDPDRDYRQLLREVLESSPRFEGLRLRGLDVHLSVAVTSDPRACWLDTKDPEGWARQYAVWLDEADPEGDVSHLAHTHWLPNGERLQMACAMCEQTDDHGDDDEEWELV